MLKETDKPVNQMTLEELAELVSNINIEMAVLLNLVDKAIKRQKELKYDSRN
jgi:hypothetical protein